MSQPPSEPTAERREAPTSFGGILLQLGPGLIIAGSIVGSGELVATTKTGAQAGISLLWLIIIGCLIKVFVQVELGRHAISTGDATLTSLNRIGGPRFCVNWILWYWMVMMAASMGQLGGIVAGVGQSLSLACPISGDYIEAIRTPSKSEIKHYLVWKNDIEGDREKLSKLPADEQDRILRRHKILHEAIEKLGQQGQDLLTTIGNGGDAPDPPSWDVRIWATVTAVITALMLYFGRYGLLQTLTTVMVVSFTAITVGNVIALQQKVQWSLSWNEILSGLKFGFPAAREGISPIGTALATFGIIGVGATELIAYPYWCLEKGYAKHVGPKEDSEGWRRRARGWDRVMLIDALVSMVVYTVATLAFYWMGVAVLYREGRDPDGMRMVSTLATAYVPIFGLYAKYLFLAGAIAVLYSTYLVASAGHARTIVDALVVSKFVANNEKTKSSVLDGLSFAFPLICLLVYFTLGENPIKLILWSGLSQAVMLPILAGSALYFRYREVDSHLVKRGIWDLCLWISSLGMAVVAVWTIGKSFFKW